MLSNCPSVRLSVRPFVPYQSREHDVLRKNEPNLPQVGTSDPRGKEMKRSTFGVRRSKMNVEVRLGDLAEASVSTISVQ